MGHGCGSGRILPPNNAAPGVGWRSAIPTHACWWLAPGPRLRHPSMAAGRGAAHERVSHRLTPMQRGVGFRQCEPYGPKKCQEPNNWKHPRDSQNGVELMA